MQESQTHLSALLARVESGERIVLALASGDAVFSQFEGVVLLS